jgi:hypothetical protein
MLDGFEEFLFDVFKLTLRLMWAVARPTLPYLVRGLYALLSYPVSWPVILVVALWGFTDHSIAPSIIAIAALGAVLAAVLLRPGLR